jgi:hypothetical protein
MPEEEDLGTEGTEARGAAMTNPLTKDSTSEQSASNKRQGLRHGDFDRRKSTFPEVSNAPDFFKVVEDLFLADVVKNDRNGGNKSPKNGPENVVTGRGRLNEDSHKVLSIIRNYKGGKQ